MKFSIKDFCGFDFCSYLRIWSHLLKKSLMENFIFCAVMVVLERRSKISICLHGLFISFISSTGIWNHFQTPWEKKNTHKIHVYADERYIKSQIKHHKHFWVVYSANSLVFIFFYLFLKCSVAVMYKDSDDKIPEKLNPKCKAVIYSTKKSIWGLNHNQ